VASLQERLRKMRQVLDCPSWFHNIEYLNHHLNQNHLSDNTAALKQLGQRSHLKESHSNDQDDLNDLIAHVQFWIRKNLVGYAVFDHVVSLWNRQQSLHKSWSTLSSLPILSSFYWAVLIWSFVATFSPTCMGDELSIETSLVTFPEDKNLTV